MKTEIIGKKAKVVCLKEQLDRIGITNFVYPGDIVEVISYEMKSNPNGDWYRIKDKGLENEEMAFSIPLRYLEILE